MVFKLPTREQLPVHNLLFVVYFEVKKYNWLVNGTAQTQVNTFLAEKHTFDEYTKVRILKLNFFHLTRHMFHYDLTMFGLPLNAFNLFW